MCPCVKLIKHYAMKTYGGGVDVSIHVLVTSALGGGEWSTSRPGRFTPGTHCIEGLGGPQNRSGRRGKGKNISPTGTQTPTTRPFSP
jgi:hypothetical protein